MNAKRMHYLLLALLLLMVIGIVGGAYEVNALLGKKAVTLANLKLQTQSLQQQQTSLIKAKKDIATYSGLEQITQQIVPQDKDQAEAVREIVNIASNAGVQLSSISFPASSLGATTTTSGGVGATKTAPSAAISSKDALSQLLPVPGISGVYDLQITIQNDNSTYTTYPQLYNMLSALEKNRRTAEVSNILIQPNPQNHNQLTFVLTLSEYIKPS